MPFLFEKLDVYVKSVELTKICEALSIELKGKASFSTLDQMTRAAYSVPLNIAEGNGRWHKAEKRQFFRIAQGSIYEIVPILQVILGRGLITNSRYAEIYLRLENILKMLTMLIRSVDGLRR